MNWNWNKLRHWFGTVGVVIASAGASLAIVSDVAKDVLPMIGGPKGVALVGTIMTITAAVHRLDKAVNKKPDETISKEK
jgi:hypothetical protein